MGAGVRTFTKIQKGSNIKTSKEAVLLLNMGGPSNLYEVRTFLTNLFNDPYILQIKSRFFRKIISSFIVNRRLETSKGIYKAIGGKSPMVETIFSLTQKLNSFDAQRYYTYAMRYTPPYTEDVLRDLQNQGFDSIILLSMYPQYSTTTTLSSLSEVHRCLKLLDYKPSIKIIERFYDDITFNQSIISQIQSLIQKQDSREFVLIFSAHGLPESIVQKGDTYQEECEKNVEILKGMIEQSGIEFLDIVLSYQSKVGPMKWIGPSTDEIVKKYVDKKIIIYPLSFTIDNSETKYELCIQYRELAQNAGVKEYIVSPCLNDTQEFVEIIFGLVKSLKGVK
ncbi:ferrochelatase [Helicobacter sp. 13S00477-4]|uniref:ferrochelatase n=1 Tax=Helicobacter sp. 13S00477-4 TaxID=1905759 RepID=UPI000BA607F9|nr:ferrochelatase [Helicobacter sp. 13S00477-4]PAF52275.1 ferrochelatase [Helicobacter sp. 13S00477-4]